MAEYIDREGLRKILETWRDAHADVDDEDGFSLLEDVLQELNAQATADVAPAGRCKDCKWYEPYTDWVFDKETGRYGSNIIKLSYGECHGQDFNFTEDGCLRVGEGDFCSCWERRDGGEKSELD